MRRLVVALLLLVLPALAARADQPAGTDPMQSPVWAALAEKYLPGAPIVFDDRVKVVLPVVVENQAQVPVAADARGLQGVEKLVVIADLNPIQQVLTLIPARAEPYVAFRMKVEQGTPVRVAALAGGVWHVGSSYLDAMGGGCSAPPMARKDRDWSATVGQAQGKLWRAADGAARLRLRIRHPMDTGLARDNTPAYFIERLEVAAEQGGPLAVIELFEPVAEDPTLTLALDVPVTETAIRIDARDNNGAIFRSIVPAARQTGALNPGIAIQ